MTVDQLATPLARAEAEAALRDIARRSPGDADRRDIAVNLGDLAALVRRRGDALQAEGLYLQALAIEERLLGFDHPDLAVTLDHLAALYEARGRCAEADRCRRRAAAILGSRAEAGRKPAAERVAA